MTALPDGLLVAWYGDDFTGSAAVMEVLTFAGLQSVLFLDVPTPEQLARFGGVRAIGIASTARAHGTEWMDAHLPVAFATLAGLGAQITHYKMCSTLDSSSEIGSVGRAIDLALPVIPSAWTPVLVAAPPMRRYQAFGNLFASGPGGVSRLDRHPVMARHPVTPMDEADVAGHLSRQTKRPIGLVTLEDLTNPRAAEAARVANVAAGSAVMALDCIDGASLSACGRLIWEARGPHQFAVGSQGVEYALVRYWQDSGLIPEPPAAGGIGPTGPMAVASGSVSPVTAAQINWSLEHGFEGIDFDARAVVDPGSLADEEAAAVAAALAAVGQGRDPLIFTARGPDDPAVPALHAALAAAALPAEEANVRIGAALGRVLDAVIRGARLRRAVISGGDTSGYASRQLGIYALTALAPTIAGAAIFRAHGDGALDGLELALKGGQMGSPDYFCWVRDGGGPRD